MSRQGSNANASIPSPQPFSVDEIRVCGRVFPQPLVTDRLIMDRQAFLANIVAENVSHVRFWTSLVHQPSFIE